MNKDEFDKLEITPYDLVVIHCNCSIEDPLIKFIGFVAGTYKQSAYYNEDAIQISSALGESEGANYLMASDKFLTLKFIPKIEIIKKDFWK